VRGTQLVGSFNYTNRVNIEVMDLHGWDQRYRVERDAKAAPTPLVMETAQGLNPGRALDLACGTGRNALWLARHGWSVTAVDGSGTAIEILRQSAVELGLQVDSRVADLQAGEYAIEPASWDLISICYYLQRDLLEPAKLGIVPGGVLMVIVHIGEPGEEPTPIRLRPGELVSYFQGWQILHNYEGKPRDAAHARAVAEIVVRRV
jgi:tellurite methyltransferase